MARLPPKERAKILRNLSTKEAAELEYDWGFWSRPSQRPPEGRDWSYFMMVAGRGSGKTRAGAEWIRQAKDYASPIALIGPTVADVRDVMIDGPAGLKAISPAGDYPVYEPSKRRLTWPNGAHAITFSADAPERLRGPQHAVAWCDELAAWNYAETVWQMLLFGLRLGRKPRCIITTTPRPIKLIRDLMRDPLCRVSIASSYANRANLAQDFLDRIIKPMEGTRLGRQEIEAEILEDIPGALWSRDQLEQRRWPLNTKLPEMVRIVVAIDPAATSGEDADETGIVVAGKDANGFGYVLADHSGRYPPVGWAKKAIELYKGWGADRVVAEVNNGGEMVEATLRMIDPNVPYRSVHASRGKGRRAEPVSALYEARPDAPFGKVWHAGTFPRLEDQLVELTVDFDRARAGYSPDRADALVWALTDLMVEQMPNEGIYLLYQEMARAAKSG